MISQLLDSIHYYHNDLAPKQSSIINKSSYDVILLQNEAISN